MTQQISHKSKRSKRIAVIGGGECDSQTAQIAEEVGREIAQAGAWLICGGLGGVMAAASRGAQEAGGYTLGLLPGIDPEQANPWIDVPIVTGLGEGRNLLVVRNADAVIAIGGEWGTLSEIALACKTKRPIILLNSWSLTTPQGNHVELATATTPQEAVQLALMAVEPERGSTPIGKCSFQRKKSSAKSMMADPNRDKGIFIDLSDDMLNFVDL